MRVLQHALSDSVYVSIVAHRRAWWKIGTIVRPALAVMLCMVSALARAGDVPKVSSATTMKQAGMINIRSRVPDVSQSIAYASSDNFVGVAIDGYDAPYCWLKRDVAVALARVETVLRKHHMRLRLFDCYRPARAVAQFVRWANDSGDQHTKAAHYPNLDKSQLLGEYVAPVSVHSRGSAVDLTLLKCDELAAGCEPLDMGTGFDFFGTRANTDSSEVSAEQRANRHLLRAAMAAQGFVNYPMEWWHFSLRSGSSLKASYDIPVAAHGESMRRYEVDRLMRVYEGNVPGASLLVVRSGKVLIKSGYGRSDLERETDAGPATNYRLASVTKQFTAAAILLLAQDAILSIEDPVRRWLPELPKSADSITLHHLLDHTSGLLDYEDLMAKPYKGQISDAGVLALLAGQDRLYFPPGSTYRYSNSGYAMLALVIKRASGLSYAEFLHSHIFARLGMHDTLAWVAGGPDVPHRAWGYSKKGAGWERTDQNEYSAVLGDGGIYSNIDDLARWDAALCGDRLFSEKTRMLAFGKQVQVSSEPEATYYGFGWRVTDDRQWHSGESIGFRNTFVRWPKQHLSVILLSNRNDPTPYSTAIEIGKLFLADGAAESR